MLLTRQHGKSPAKCFMHLYVICFLIPNLTGFIHEILIAQILEADYVSYIHCKYYISSQQLKYI